MPLSLEDFHRETLTGHNDLVILFWVQSPSNLCYFGNMFQALTAINTLLQLKSIEPLILVDFWVGRSIRENEAAAGGINGDEEETI
ncbi:hypothetical protein Bca52824_087291 [Brassica carinata]|uniref:Uncharacterized protein n=1 Tax=Brassica carinata TaxID=52824 RepID=A0A8X7PBE1_BRACI|nr:hypothetical protein Bca52824_087291 [Brassica carinata]